MKLEFNTAQQNITFSYCMKGELNYIGKNKSIFHHLIVLEGINLNIRQFKNTKQPEGQC